MKRKAILTYLLLSIFLLVSLPPRACLAVSDVADGSVKTPVLLPEESVSTYVPSASTGEKGVAVNIILPEKPRYADGAPVVVMAPGGSQADGLSFTMHAAQQGFVEVRLAFPGGGKAKFSSGGIYDYRGVESQLAFKDVILFAAGKIADSQGRHLSDLVPMRVSGTNVGLVGWSNGGNIVMTTMSKYAPELSPIVSWVAFYESPIGPLFYPPNLGGADDLLLNPHYAPGSSASGEVKVDWHKLKWEYGTLRNAGEHKKRGEPEIRGVLYFDENSNGKWDEPSEFALHYCLDVGLEKQIYPPEVVHHLDLSGIFLQFMADTRKTDKTDNSVRKPEKKPGKKKADAKASDAADEPADSGKDSEPEKSQSDQSDGKDKVAEKPMPEGSASTNDKSTGGADSDGGPAKKKKKIRRVTVWPGPLATLSESEGYFQDRDGALCFGTIAAKYPDLMVTILGTQVDHLQRQLDHPHITLQYNAWLANKAHWVRLNPEPIYIACVANMNVGNFTYNKPNSSIDAATITTFLEPEGLTKDYVFMEAAIAELADRRRAKNLKSPLSTMLTPYYNSANPAPPVKPDKSGSAPAKPAQGEDDDQPAATPGAKSEQPAATPAKPATKPEHAPAKSAKPAAKPAP